MARELVNEPPNVLIPLDDSRAAPASFPRSRRQRRDTRRQGHDETRNGRAARRRSGFNALRTDRDHALEWRQRGDAAGRFIGKASVSIGGISIQGRCQMEDMKGTWAAPPAWSG